MQNRGPHHGHHASEDELSAYLDGELGPRQAKRLERHLRACASCQRELAELRATRLLLRRLPQRPLPRSFLLPASVANARRRQHVWNTGFVVLRGAAVAVSLALVVLLSGNALLRRGLLPVPGQAEQTAAVTAVEEQLAAQPEMATAEEIMPTPSTDVWAAGAQDEQGALARARAVLPTATTAMGAASLTGGAETAQELAAEEPTQVRGSPLDHEGPLTALVEEPRPAQPTVDEVDGVFSAAAKAGDTEEESTTAPDRYGAVVETDATPASTPTALAPTPEPTSASMPAATEPEPGAQELTAEPLAQPTGADEASSGLVAGVAPTMAPLAEAEGALSAPAQEAPIAPLVTPIDTWQQGLHAATGVLVGVLLMVVAGLVWTDHMRRR